MSCLYGLKLLKEAGFVPKIPIRILFGTDEESGSADIPLYLQKERPPLFGFTPDCKYPVVYGERGVVGYRITSRFSEEDLAVIGPIKGEQGRAFVPEQLSVTAAGERFRVSGKKAPSNAPELGENAITLLAEALKEQAALPSTLHTYFAWISEHLHQQHKGEGLGIAYQDADSGALMLTPVLLEKVAAGFVLDLSIRYPISAAEEQITEQLQKALPANSTLTVTRRMKSSCFSKEHLGVRLLTDVYEDVMQTAGQPVTTTGATYARFMPNIVAFGPSFPGQKGIAHNRDEWMAAADLLLNMKIYMNAMIQLSQRNLAEYEEEGK